MDVPMEYYSASHELVIVSSSIDFYPPYIRSLK